MPGKRRRVIDDEEEEEKHNGVESSSEEEWNGEYDIAEEEEEEEGEEEDAEEEEEEEEVEPVRGGRKRGRGKAAEATASRSSKRPKKTASKSAAKPEAAAAGKKDTKPSFKTDQTWTRKHNKSGRRGTWKSLKQILTSENQQLQDLPPTVPTYSNIEAPMSMFPPKKYCDVTGLQGRYTTASRPHIRYHSAAVYKELLPYIRYEQERVDIRTKGL